MEGGHIGDSSFNFAVQQDLGQQQFAPTFGLPPAPQQLARTVRVRCEAADCNALLQVTIPPAQAAGMAPVIVRCGNCSR